MLGIVLPSLIPAIYNINNSLMLQNFIGFCLVLYSFLSGLILICIDNKNYKKGEDTKGENKSGFLEKEFQIFKKLGLIFWIFIIKSFFVGGAVI